MRGLLALVLIAGAAGCKSGTSSLQVTVGSDGVVHGVALLHVVAASGGQTARPIDFPLAGAPVDIPPEQSFTLVFGANVRGAVALTIDAWDASQQSLATAMQMATVTPGQLSTATVTLPGMHPVTPSYTVSGFVSALGGGVSSGAGFAVEGAVGIPGPRVVSSNGAITVEPLIPRSEP